MYSIYLALAVIWAHWVADFLLQSDEMAKKKSSSVFFLSYHVAIYSTVLLIMFGWPYAVVNGIAHWIVDFISSKVTSRLYAANENHWFFVVIGLDQAIHVTVLLLTLPLLGVGI